MPSPFPGMDPYLEGPTWWEGFRARLIIAMDSLLNRDLPEGFASHVQERVYVEESPRLRYIPDAAISIGANRPAARGADRSGGLAVAAAPASTAPRILRVDFQERREAFLEVRTTRGNKRVVAVIELLSPANKAEGRGREEYRAKQRRLLESDVHLLEIDLLRTGQYTVSAPEWALREEAEWDYLVCLHRAGRIGEYEYWPIRLYEPLPSVHVPLAEGVADFRLDLQAAFTRAYDEGPYRRDMDYSEPAEVPLAEEQSDRADALLRAAGLREQP
jgi:hypothetical protein